MAAVSPTPHPCHRCCGERSPNGVSDGEPLPRLLKRLLLLLLLLLV